MMEFHEAANIFPMMSEDEYQALKQDIADHGLREPIWIHEDKIIDGRNRWKACQELGIDCPSRRWDGNGSLIAFIISMNLHRRHLTASQRAMIALDALPFFEAEAKERQGTRTDIVEIIPECYGNARDYAAQVANVNPHYVQDAKAIAEKSPELTEQVRAGAITIPEAKRAMRKQERAEQERAYAESPLPDAIELICVDFRQANIADDSIDAIITDPPYSEIRLYQDLAKRAARWLKPGGSLLAMSGQLYLQEILNLMSSHLHYQWMLAYLTPGGQSPQIWTRKVNTFWKPVLWFVKGDYSGGWIGDVCKSDRNDKRFHEWGQSEQGISEIVEKFTSPGQLILDPFLGGGTTAIVAITLHRRFIGIDINQSAINTTRGRLAIATS